MCFLCFLVIFVDENLFNIKFVILFKMSIEIIIEPEYDGVKPKNFLRKKLDVPFFMVVKMISEKRISLNGKKIKKDSVLKKGDVLKVWPHDIKLREETKNHRNKKDLGLDVIFENDDFIVFNKLPDVVVQGAQHNDMSLSLHLAYYQDKIGENLDFEFFHVHRLDKDTSGCLVVAKNKVALRELNEVFRKKDIVKKYLCLCVGEFDSVSGKVDVIMRRCEQGVREKMRIVADKKPGDKRSISLYKVVDEFEFRNEVFSLVEVEIKTGVTHQIRVHMKSLGHPIFGDNMYGVAAVNSEFEKKLSRQFLHASHLEFDYKGKHFSFDAPLSSDLDSFLRYIKNGD